MVSAIALIFAKGAVALVGGGFVALTWQDVANAAYASILGAMGRPESELFTPWGPIGMIIAGAFFGWLAYKTA